MKKKKLLAFAVASILATAPIATPVFAETDTMEQTETRQKHSHNEDVAAPDNAIAKDVAKQTALTDASIAAEQAGKVKAHLSQMDDGTIAYKVKFTYEGTDYSYVIDAVTGSILDKTTSAASEQESHSHGKGKHGKGMRREKTDAAKQETQTSL